MKRHLETLRYEWPLALIVAMLVSAFVFLIVVVITGRTAEAVTCEERGGHIYNRTVGKIHYHKCVTDDNQVIVL